MFWFNLDARRGMPSYDPPHTMSTVPPLQRPLDVFLLAGTDLTTDRLCI